MFRSGYYGGAGARLFSTLLGGAGRHAAGLREHGQPGPARLLELVGHADAHHDRDVALGRVPAARHAPRHGRNTHILLVVRDDGRDARGPVRRPRHARYQAYNYCGGKSLYDDNSTGAQTVAGTARAVKVSFDRPYQAAARRHPARLVHAHRLRRPCRGSRSAGYDVSLHRGLRPRALRRRGARPPRLHLRRPRRVLVGRHAHRARAGARRGRRPLLHRRQRGVLEGAVRGRARCPRAQDRVLVSYKSTQSGGPDPSGIPTGTWRDPAGANQPENALTGVQYIGQKNFDVLPAARAPRPRARTGSGATPASTRRRPARRPRSARPWSAGSGTRASDNGREPPGRDHPRLLARQRRHPAGRGPQLRARLGHLAHGQVPAPSGALIVSTGTNHWNWGLAPQRAQRGRARPPDPAGHHEHPVRHGRVPRDARRATSCSTTRARRRSSPCARPPPTPPTSTPSTVVRAGFSRPMDPASLTSSVVQPRAVRTAPRCRPP